MEYLSNLKDKKEFKNGPIEKKTGIFGMKVVIDYQKLYDEFLNYFNNNEQ